MTPLQVLVVEDSPAMRQLLRQTLSRLDAVIREAADGVEALKLLGQLRDELAVSATAVAVITSSDSAEVEQQTRSLGASYFLRKPVHRRDLDRILQEVFPSA